MTDEIDVGALIRGARPKPPPKPIVRVTEAGVEISDGVIPFPWIWIITAHEAELLAYDLLDAAIRLEQGE